MRIDVELDALLWAGEGQALCNSGGALPDFGRGERRVVVDKMDVGSVLIVDVEPGRFGAKETLVSMSRIDGWVPVGIQRTVNGARMERNGIGGGRIHRVRGGIISAISI